MGENGHLAFDHLPVADFADQRDVKVVELEAACRMQQVHQGHFPDIAAVPAHAITVTIPRCSGPAAPWPSSPRRKAQPVAAALTGPITRRTPRPRCGPSPTPASISNPLARRLLPTEGPVRFGVQDPRPPVTS